MKENKSLLHFQPYSYDKHKYYIMWRKIQPGKSGNGGKSKLPCNDLVYLI